MLSITKIQNHSAQIKLMLFLKFHLSINVGGRNNYKFTSCLEWKCVHLCKWSSDIYHC